MKTYDVFAVNIEDSKVRILDSGRSEDNAEAIVSMAVMRRGCDEEFFVTAISGLFKDGDTWDNDKAKKAKQLPTRI